MKSFGRPALPMRQRARDASMSFEVYVLTDGRHTKPSITTS
jgi:hypothetical protein